MDTQALWLTLRLALSTTAVLLVIALPLAWWICSGTGAVRVRVIPTDEESVIAASSMRTLGFESL